MNQRLAYIIFAFAFVVAIIAGFFSPTDEKPTPSDFRAKIRETIPVLKPTPKEKGTSIQTPTRTLAAIAPSSVPFDLRSFERKYGESLRIQQYEGRTTRMENFAEAPGPANYRTSDSAALRARAEEVFKDSRGLLGIGDSLEFGEPLVEPGDTNGRVTFQQTIDGVALYPGGTVTILIGAQGQLRTLDSSIYPKTKVLNTARGPAPEASRTVLFVTESEPVALLRAAYDTRVKGIQTVTDAETGTVLFERNRRIQ